MRRSMIKFGNSFTSSFHLTKQKTTAGDQLGVFNKKMTMEREEKETSVLQKRKQTGKFNFHPREDEINKKFDEMEEILMELQ